MNRTCWLLVVVVCIVGLVLPAQAQEERIIVYGACPGIVNVAADLYILSPGGELHGQGYLGWIANHVFLRDERLITLRILEQERAIEVYDRSPDVWFDADLPPTQTINLTAYDEYPEEMHLLRGVLSPDGRYFAFATEFVGINPEGGPFALMDETQNWIYVLNLTNNQLHVAGRYKMGTTGLLAWSPDNTRIAFESLDGRVIIAAVASLPTARIAFGAAPHIDSTVLRLHLAWSPDGVWVAYTQRSLTSTRYMLRVRNTQTGDDALLLESRQSISAPLWTPDSGSLLLRTIPEGSQEREYLRLAPDGTELPPLDYPTGVRGLSWSPDGAWFIYAEDGEGDTTETQPLMIMDVEGRETFVLAALPPGFSVNRISWQVVASESVTRALVIGDLAEIFVLDDGLNLRDAPSVRGTLIERMPIGTRVELIGGPEVASGYRWWQLRAPSGAEGWAVEAADGIETLRRVSAESDQPWAPPAEPIALVCER